MAGPAESDRAEGGVLRSPKSSGVKRVEIDKQTYAQGPFSSI